jgi:hypothetical protein
MSKTPHSTSPYRCFYFPPVDYLDGDDLQQPRKHMHPRLQRNTNTSLLHNRYDDLLSQFGRANRQVWRDRSPLSTDIAAFDHVGPAGAKRWYIRVSLCITPRCLNNEQQLRRGANRRHQERRNLRATLLLRVNSLWAGTHYKLSSWGSAVEACPVSKC